MKVADGLSGRTATEDINPSLDCAFPLAQFIMSVAHGIRSLGVIGAGQMGTFDDHHTDLLCVVILFQGLGIAYVAALRAKVNVQLYDRSSDQVTKGLSLMDKLLAKDLAKGKIQEADARQARERVSVVDRAVGVRALRDTDMVIEVRRQKGLALAAFANGAYAPRLFLRISR